MSNDDVLAALKDRMVELMGEEVEALNDEVRLILLEASTHELVTARARIRAIRERRTKLAEAIKELEARR